MSVSVLCQTSPEEMLKQVAAHWAKNRTGGTTFTYDVEHKVYQTNPWGADLVNTEKFEVLVIEGLPYMRLVQINGKPLSAKQAAAEQAKYEKSVDERKHLNKQNSAYNVNLKIPIDWLPDLFSVKLNTKQEHDTNIVVLDCEPRSSPSNDDEKEVLAHSYRLWINTDDWMPVKMESKVINNNSRMFAGSAEKGSLLTYEWQKIGATWVIASSSSSYRVRFSGGVSAQGRSEDTYSNYKEFHAKATIVPGP